MHCQIRLFLDKGCLCKPFADACLSAAVRGCRELEKREREEKEREKEERKRRERQNRDAFKALMAAHRAEGVLTAKMRWKVPRCAARRAWCCGVRI